jgi:DNA-binding response OmpR family regulator
LEKKVMNTDQRETDEEQIDIFVLSQNPQDATQLAQNLSPHGYRVTLFTDIPQLFDSIRAGKPNLLICDAASTEPDGYALCREIKKDYDLWQIPILLIARSSDLSDLLNVLDSNADNFIAQPYEERDLLPLIETMVAERVEKPDPEKVKTRFKIRHEDHDYVILADRRKLLNFLISSYELAVSRTRELEQVQSDLQDLREDFETRVKKLTQALSSEVERLEALAKEHSRTLSQREKDIHNLEAREKGLHEELAEKEATISRQAAFLTKTAEELDQNKILYKEAEERNRTLGSEKEDLKRSLEEEIDSLRIARDELKVELESTKRAHSDALDQISSHEVRHADLTSEKEQTDATIRSLTLELDDLKHALNGQKDRATAAENDVQSLKKAKADSEQEQKKRVDELTGVTKKQALELESLKHALSEQKNRATAAENEIQSLKKAKADSEQEQKKRADDLTNIVKEQALELEKQKTALTAGAKRTDALMQQIQALAQEKERCEAVLGTERQSLREQRDAIQEKFNTTTASLGAERQKTVTLMQELQSVSGTNEKLKEDIHTMSRRLEIAETACEEEKQLRFISDKNAKEALAAKDEAEKSYQKLFAGLHDDKKTYSEELALAHRELDTLKSAHRKLEDELAATVLIKVQSEKFAQSLSSELENMRGHAEAERKERQALEERLRDERQAKDRTEQSLRTLSSEKANDTSTLSAKIQALSSELERVRAQVETERKERQSVEGHLREERLARDKTEQSLRTLTGEKASATSTLSAKVQALSEKVDAEAQKKRSLEQQLDTLTRQQSETKAALQACAKERESLAKATKDREKMLHEREEDLAKAREELAQAKTRLQSAMPASPAPVSNHALTLKGPDLPRVVEVGSHEIAVVDTGHHDIVAVPAEPAVSPAPVEQDEASPPEIRSVEDLFEDEPETDIPVSSDSPGAPVTADPAEQAEDFGEPESQEEEEREGPLGEVRSESGEHDIPVTASPETDSEEIHEEEVSVTKPEEPTSGALGTPNDPDIGYMPRGIPFDRRQWFDLVKWVHSTPSLSHEEKLRIVRLGRLLQKGKRLTHKQDEQVAELVTLAYTRGYKPK